MQLQPALQILKSRAPFIPDLAIVLGSGLGGLADSAEALAGTSVSFKELPGFPEQSVAGHSGRMMFCEFEGKKVVLQAGRFHYYEGHPMDVVTAPMRLYGRLGVKAVLHTNAAGAINPGFQVGELMAISDHINFMGTNPLIGPNVPPGPRFHDMTEAYDRKLREQLHAAAKAINLRMQEGVYLAVTGPNYESPAEIRAFRAMGADAVGMSTVPEVLVARHEGLRVAGISGLCNMGAGIMKVTLTHEDVLAAGAAAAKGFEALVRKFVEDLQL